MATVLTGSRTQQMAALARANEVRMLRATLKRDLKAGRRSPEQVLLNPPECIASMSLADFLLVLPALGPVKVNRLLARCRVLPSKRLAALSPRQRMVVIEALGFSPAPISEPAPRSDGLSCSACGIRMRTRAELCGFCAVERTEAA